VLRIGRNVFHERCREKAARWRTIECTGRTLLKTGQAPEWGSRSWTKWPAIVRWGDVGFTSGPHALAHVGEPAPTRSNTPFVRARVHEPSLARLIERCEPKREQRPCALVHAPLRRAAT